LVGLIHTNINDIFIGTESSYGGTMFSRSQHLVVTGGTFHNVTNNYIAPPTAPSGMLCFPTCPMKID
jgi:hypothetical protein